MNKIKLNNWTVNDFIRTYRDGGTLVLDGEHGRDFVEWTNAEILKDIRTQRDKRLGKALKAIRRPKYYVVQGLTNYTLDDLEIVDKLDWTISELVNYMQELASDKYDYKTGAHIRQVRDRNGSNKIVLGIWTDYRGNIFIDLGIIIYATSKADIKDCYDNAKAYFRAPEQTALYVYNTFTGEQAIPLVKDIKKPWTNKN